MVENEAKLNEKPFGGGQFYQGFSSKEAKNVIDKELKLWAIWTLQNLEDRRMVEYYSI